MIGQMAVRVTADRANFPLGTLFIRAGSAANVAIMGVPVRAGVDVESITLRVENVDGATTDFAARQYGGVWVVDLPASHFATVGSVANGVTVYATGTGADGETVRTWNIGVGDLEVLPADADAPAPTPGQALWPLRMFDAAPASPTKYNAYIDGTALKIWNGTAWVTISGGGGTDSVSWENVTGKPNFAAIATSGNYNDLSNKPTIPAAQVNADWNAESGVAQILNKPVFEKPPRPSDVPPQMDGTANAGNEATYSRSDHVHPTDTSRQAALSAQQLANIAAVPSKYEKPSGGIPATDLESAVQTALAEIPGKASAADLRYRIAAAEYDSQSGVYTLSDRTVNLITVTTSTSIDIELPSPVEEPTGVRRARDFFLDVDNSSNASDLALEFTKLGDDIGSADAYAFVADAEDSIGEMTTVEKNTRVRLYFTETAYTKEDGDFVVPVFHVARVTLGDFITSTTGGNS